MAGMSKRWNAAEQAICSACADYPGWGIDGVEMRASNHWMVRISGPGGAKALVIVSGSSGDKRFLLNLKQSAKRAIREATR